MAKSEKPRTKRRSPLWARLCAIFGCVLMVISGGALITSKALVARYAGAVETKDLFGNSAAGATKRPVSDIKGPVNILLVGIDPRDTSTAPLSDSIIVVHIPKGLKQAYLFSIPRDLRVEIPPFARTGFQGGTSKINAAMSYGSSTGDGKHDVAQGFDLLAKTVSKLTGIKKFDAGAIINFNGFKEIVDAMDGVTMTIDQNVKSEHLQPNGKPRPRRPECADNSCAHPYVGPQKEYKKGTYHLEGWEALDYVRQRYGLPKSDYDRQRHQQQFIKAMAEQALSKNVVTNPIKLDQVLRAAGDALIFDGNGHNVVDWGLALRGLRSNDMALVKLPGRSLFNGRQYIGEGLEPSADDFFASVNDDTIATFLVEHPDFLQKL
ncbi:LCP family protein [Pseudosporangium ferrugineum]|uniref:LytR family transcriptional attenuator n=1 Tax=Pseudosporangium ferrugineum TaxID=439699 RepID=A0A2T0SD73_9ACTN|nr:LCP family protein [Pseudosporangium ferrugineum]PRY31362.1 LytR family transcriptional attenuator [Pseudosporangium ferrugineum]